MWEVLHGPVPAGKMVLHSCDKRHCINPEHLRVGDHDANMDDMVRRQRQCRGERKKNARLNEAKVRAIRAARAAGASLVSLAKQYGVAPQTVFSAATGETWGHIK